MTLDSKNRKPFYIDAGPFNLCGTANLQNFKDTIAYKPRDDDVFIATYPKNGTTWTQQIVFCIMNNGHPPKDFAEFQRQTPYLEFEGLSALDNLTRPAALKVHLPFNLVPYNPKTKYIVVVRNIKDTVVSFYHHTRGIPLYCFQDGSFDVYFDLFLEGNVDYGDYFDWILSWIDHRNDSNVLFMTYEQMKKDTKDCIMKICRFLGPEYEEKAIKDSEFVENILKYSSVQYMKGLMNESMAKYLIDGIATGKKVAVNLNEVLGGKENPSFEFVRKGEVNDWKNLLSPQQNEKLSAKFRSKAFDHPVLYDIWQDYDWL